jgi:hypothetical protein
MNAPALNLAGRIEAEHQAAIGAAQRRSSTPSSAAGC